MDVPYTLDRKQDLQERWLDYVVMPHVPRPQGYVTLIVGQASGHIGDDAQKMFRSLGVHPTDTVTNISSFYPNSVLAQENSGDYMREGVGSSVLDDLVKEMLLRDSKMMFVFTGKLSMKAFIGKQGFERYKGTLYYRLLQSENQKT